MKKNSSQVNQMKKEGWQSMEKTLNAEMPIAEKSERKYGVWFMYSIAASFILIFTATYVSYSLLQNTPKSSSYTFVKNKKVKSISPEKYGYMLQPNEQVVNPIVPKKRKKKVEKINNLSSGNEQKTQLIEKSKKNSLNLSPKHINNNSKTKPDDFKLINNVGQNHSSNQQLEKNDPLYPKLQTKQLSDSDTSNTNKTKNETLLKNKMTTNQAHKNIQIISSINMRKALVNNKIDLGLKTNGSIGFVSKDLDQYGLRFGLEFSKPLSNNLALNTGIRYSAYKQNYNSTYKLDKEIDYVHYKVISDLSNRKVSRRFVELPIYTDYAISDAIKLKVGSLLTYNKNNSSNSNHSALSIANNTSISDVVKLQAGKLMQDKHGYLGEAVGGATIELNKVSLDVEGNYGLISNQKIDNRSVLGFRLNYKFGQ